METRRKGLRDTENKMRKCNISLSGILKRKKINNEQKAIFR